MSKTCEKCIHYEVCRYPLEYRAFPDTCRKYEEKRPHGEWIEHRTQDDFGFFHSEYECSECHDDIWQKTEWHFCPNCGASMRVTGK